MKEIERQNETMSLTVAKQIQLEKERRDELRRRDEEYQERVREL
jgi:hypothetical protein